jgi:hypothetical protein
VCAVGGHRYTPFQPKPLHPILNAPRHLILPMAHNNHSLVLSNTTTTTQVRRAARTMPSSILAHTSSKSTSARPTSARMSRTTLCTPAGSAANGRCANSSTATTTGPRVRPKPAHDFPPSELYRQSGNCTSPSEIHSGSYARPISTSFTYIGGITILLLRKS